MKLGVLSTSYPTREGEAAGRFVKEMAEALAARGHQVEALFPEHARRDHPPGENPRLTPLAYARPRVLERVFYGAGVPDNVARTPALSLLAVTYAARSLFAARAMARGWDAVIAHFLLPSGLVAVSLGLPCLVVAHSADLHLLEQLPFRRGIARRLDDGARLWFVSDEARLRFERLIGRATRVPPIVTPMGITPIEPTPRETARRRLGLDEGELVVASLSRLVPVKGLDVAVQAVARIEGATFVIGGEGPLAPALEAEGHAAGSRLRLLGALDAAGKRDLFGAADVFVVPSRTLPSGRSEGVPVALLEALAAGLPVVASRVGGIASRFASSAEIALVPEGDPGALASAIERAARARPPGSRAPTWDELADEIEASLTGGRCRSSSAASSGRSVRGRFDRSGAF